jgi:hypothetical protein
MASHTKQAQVKVDGPVSDLPVPNLHPDRVDEDHRIDRAP